jgi:hypothetical protein
MAKNSNTPMKMLLLCFTKPRTMTELQNIIYKNEMEKANYLYEIKKDLEEFIVEIKPIQDEKDKKKYNLNFITIFGKNDSQILSYTVKKQNANERIYNRTYYLSKADFIVSIIDKMFFETHNKHLSSKEAKVLFKLINSKEFRESTERLVINSIKDNVSINDQFILSSSFPLLNYLFFVFLIVYIDYNFKNKDKRNYQEKLLKYIGGYQFSNLQNDINKMKKLKILEPDKDDFSISNVPLEILKQTLITITKDFDMNLIKELAMLCPFYYEIKSMLQMFQNVGLKSDKCDFSF